MEVPFHSSPHDAVPRRSQCCVHLARQEHGGGAHMGAHSFLGAGSNVGVQRHRRTVVDGRGRVRHASKRVVGCHGVHDRSYPAVRGALERGSYYCMFSWVAPCTGYLEHSAGVSLLGAVARANVRLHVHDHDDFIYSVYTRWRVVVPAAPPGSTRHSRGQRSTVRGGVHHGSSTLFIFAMTDEDIRALWETFCIAMLEFIERPQVRKNT